MNGFFLRITGAVRQHHAFSLVELSIVLVILGLLTGGVLSGQNLIRAAELRGVSTEVTTYVSAIHTFRDKYFALPGDMPNATKFWGIANGSTGDDAACHNYTTPSPRTCNGNGDGKVLETGPRQEDAAFWKHLQLAGLIEGNYSGTWMPDYSKIIGGVNTGRSKMSNTAYWAFHAGPVLATGGWFDGDYGHTIEFTKNYDEATYGDESELAVLKPEEAWNIDTKMDDGKPAFGKVRPWRGDTSAPCTTSPGTAPLANPGAVEYRLTSSSTICVLDFANAF